MIEVLTGIITECWHIFVDAAPYVLFGFLAAGLLKAFLPEGAIARHLGKENTASVVKASLLGIPLPLCSCGVIPAAVDLRKQGASRGASAAFLVSTPESGVDSMAITYALLDPLMTIVRPIAAFLTATVAGLLINRLPPEAESAVAPASSCGCGSTPAAPQKKSVAERLAAGIGYAFGELLKDIGGWLLIGIGVAGVISFLIPDDFFTRFLGNEWLSLLVMLGVGIPLYICASASTPVAAALILKGISPGAALVFLLAGPATNAATLTVVGRFWGKRATMLYLASIAGCSLVLGWLVNRIYDWAGIDLAASIRAADLAGDSPINLVAAIILALLLGRLYLPKKGGDGCGCKPDT